MEAESRGRAQLPRRRMDVALHNGMTRTRSRAKVGTVGLEVSENVIPSNVELPFLKSPSSMHAVMQSRRMPSE